MKDWLELTRMTQGKELIVERVRIKESGISIEGEFELPPLVALTLEDQVFVAAFVKCGGNIKEMEKVFGVSYPTIKSRLKKITGSFDFINVEALESKSDVLDLLSNGEITVEEATQRLKK